MQNIQKLFTKSYAFDTFKSDLVSNASFYVIFKREIQANVSLRAFFANNTPKNIWLSIFTEEEQNDPRYALYIERKKTALCCAIDNLKKFCKEPKKTTDDKPAIKCVLKVQKDLDYIHSNFHLYDTVAKESILADLNKLLERLGYEPMKKSTKKTKTTK